jgi:GTP-binding protein
MQFLDEVKIYIKAGNGGAGCMAFRREKNIPLGGPTGGNGGRGSDVIIECVSGLNTLIDYRYKQHFVAKNGEHGKGSNRHGESRDPLILKVPVGTQIFAEDGETMIADITEEGQVRRLVKAGDGGFGNAGFKRSTNRAPRHHTDGWPGEEMWVWLRLKLISDVGLVGLPNAGKSTFLAQVTSAKPKIADYPFTTLKPQLGVVYVDDKEFVLADLPGLIEDAHLGVGLGDKFLKHLERCGILLHLIDVTQDDVVDAYKVIRKEVLSYGMILKDKIEIVVLNKCDAISEEELEEKHQQIKEYCGNDVMFISAATGHNVKQVIRKCMKIITKGDNEDEDHFYGNS